VRRPGKEHDVLKVSRITPHQVAARIARGECVAFVDGRSDRSWQDASTMLAGAVRARPPSLVQDATRLPSCKFVVVYGDGEQDLDVSTIAAGLHALGYNEVRILTGGLAAWAQLRYPVQSKPEPTARA
jgi:3-mercaptopyruvate sulfurtransferase SseA